MEGIAARLHKLMDKIKRLSQSPAPSKCVDGYRLSATLIHCSKLIVPPITIKVKGGFPFVFLLSEEMFCKYRENSNLHVVIYKLTGSSAPLNDVSQSVH